MNRMTGLARLFAAYYVLWRAKNPDCRNLEDLVRESYVSRKTIKKYFSSEVFLDYMKELNGGTPVDTTFQSWQVIAMGIYVGNTRDEAQNVDRVWIGAHDLAAHVYRIYLGNESGEAELVWQDDEYIEQLEKEKERDAR